MGSDGLRTLANSLPASRHPEEESFLRECLGTGGGEVCLDVACGTGRFGPILADAGYRAVGFDLSADQLRFARRRLAAVRADIRSLPVPDGSVGTATGMFFHTDVEDFAAVVGEVARCLRRGGRFIYLGAGGTGVLRTGPRRASLEHGLPHRKDRLAAPEFTRVPLVSAVWRNNHPALRCMRCAARRGVPARPPDGPRLGSVRCGLHRSASGRI